MSKKEQLKPADSVNDQPQEDDKSPEQGLSLEELQKQAMATQSQLLQLIDKFGEIRAVSPDGTVLLSKKNAEGTIDQSELTADDLKALIKQVQDLENPDHKLTLGKMAYQATAIAAYIAQNAVATNKDKVVGDFTGTPLQILPPIPNVSKEPLAQFGVFNTNKQQDIAQIIQSSIEQVYGAAGNDIVLADACRALEAFVHQSATVETAFSKKEVSADAMRYKVLENKIIFSTLTRDQILQDSLELYKRGHRLGEGSELTRLQDAVDMMERLEQRLPPHMRRPQFIQTKGGDVDYSIKILEVSEDGQSVLALDEVKKQIRYVEREELLQVLETRQNPELMGLFMTLMTLDIARQSQKANPNEMNIYDVGLDKEFDVNETWVAFQDKETLSEMLKTASQAQLQSGYPFPIKVVTKSPNAQANVVALNAHLTQDDMMRLSSMHFLKEEIIGAWEDEFKDKKNSLNILSAFTNPLFENVRGMQGDVFGMLKRNFSTILSADEVQALIDQETSPQTRVELEAKLAEMQQIAGEHAEVVEEHQDKQEAQAHITQTVLARGRQSDKAYETWKTIHELPNEQQAAAQLRAFAPSVANDIKEGASSADYDGDYIKMAQDAWTKGRIKDVKDALGDLSPMEEALMHYTLDAAQDSIRYIVMTELAAYDPTILMRKEKATYLKHLDSAALIYKSNGGVEPLQNVDSHLARWFGWYEKDCDRNLIDMVSYNTPDNSQASEHHHYTFYFCMADFFNNARALSKSNALDYVGLGGLANRFMAVNNPHRLTREIVQAINAKDLSKLDIDQDRFDQIIALSTHISNRPEDKGELHQGTSLLTGTYVRWRAAEDAYRKNIIEAAKKSAPKPSA